MSMNLAQKYYFTTLLLHLLLETGPPFYMVIRVKRRSSSLQCKWSALISQLFFFSTFKIRPQESSRYMQSSALPTELILPWSQLQYLLEISYFNTKVIVLIIKIVFVPRLLENNDIFIGNIIFDNLSLIQNGSLKHCKLQFSCLCENLIFARS